MNTRQKRIECRFRYICSKTWEELQSTDNADVKFCKHCRHNVYLAHNESEFEEHTARGRCVAIERDEGEQMLIGYPKSN